MDGTIQKLDRKKQASTYKDKDKDGSEGIRKNGK